MKKKEGFTLVELLAVIVILGVLLLIAVPTISNVINKDKSEVFIANANLYLSTAKTLNYGSNDEIVFYELKELSKQTSSPFGGNLRGKVIGIKKISFDEYDYYIYLEDDNGNTLGYDAIGNKFAINEEKLKNTNFRLNQKLQDGNEFSSTLLNSNPYISKNTFLLYQNEKSIIYSLNDNRKIDYIEYMPGASVTVKLSDELDYVGATIIKQVNDTDFEVLLDYDFYFYDAKQNGIDEYLPIAANGRIALEHLENRLKNKINKNFKNKNVNLWKNAKNIRPLSTTDINDFAKLLGDNGKIECNSNKCKNTIKERNYLDIMTTFKVGNVNVRRKSSKLNAEDLVADTWLFDENLCIYNQNNEKPLTILNDRCPVIDFSTNKVFLGKTKKLSDDTAPVDNNLKVVLTIDKEHIKVFE